VCRNKLSMRRKKKKKNLLRGPPYNKPEEKYGSPEDLVNWSKEKENKKEAKKLLTIRVEFRNNFLRNTLNCTTFGNLKCTTLSGDGSKISGR